MNPRRFSKSFLIVNILALLLLLWGNVAVFLMLRDYQPPYGFAEGATTWITHTGAMMPDFEGQIEQEKVIITELEQFVNKNNLTWVYQKPLFEKSSLAHHNDIVLAIGGNLSRFNGGIKHGRWFTNEEIQTKDASGVVPIIVPSTGTKAEQYLAGDTKCFVFGKKCEIIGVFDPAENLLTSTAAAEYQVPSIVCLANSLPVYWVEHTISSVDEQIQDGFAQILANNTIYDYQPKALQVTAINAYSCLATMLTDNRTIFITLSLAICILALATLILLECLSLRKCLAIHRQCGMRTHSLLIQTVRRLLPRLAVSLTTYGLYAEIVRYFLKRTSFVQVSRIEALSFYVVALGAWLGAIAIYLMLINFVESRRNQRGLSYV